MNKIYKRKDSCNEVIFINKLRMFSEEVTYSQVKVYSSKTIIPVHSCSSVLIYIMPDSVREKAGKF